MKKELMIDGKSVEYFWEKEARGGELTYQGKTYRIEEWGDGIFSINGQNIKLWRDGSHVSARGLSLLVENPRELKKKKAGGDSDSAMTSPMPGKILKVFVGEGDKVEKGQGLLVMEAMKMEHTIKAATDGTVQKVFFKEGELVDGGVELVELEES